MTDAAVATPTVREQTRTLTQEEFAKAHTKDALVSAASAAGIKVDAIKEAKTKADIVALIYVKYPPPDPALRGKSSVANPVAEVWAHAENRFELFRNKATEKPRRCDVVEECKSTGIAHFTARTQYQAWFKHTGGGERTITPKDDGLPKGLGALLGFPQPEPAEEEVADKK